MPLRDVLGFTDAIKLGGGSTLFRVGVVGLRGVSILMRSLGG